MGDNREHIIFNHTPKCQPELAVKGIEYSWGCTNHYHRQLSLDKNKGRIFFNIIQEAMSIFNLTKNWFSIFDRNEKEYIIAYKTIIHKKTIVGLDIDLFTNISIGRIEKMVKDLNIHI